MRSRAELYDWELAHVARRSLQDLAGYAVLAARAGGPVLELACGTGRLTVPLSAVGLDIDEAMLAVARRRGARQLVQADMRSFCLGRRFGLVAIPYNSLQLLLDDDDLLACLRCAARHLLPHGALALEVADFQAGAVRSAVGAELLGRAEGMSLYGALVLDLSRRVTTYHRRFQEGGESRVDHVRLRCFDEAELVRLIIQAGLQLVDLTKAGTRLFCVARAGEDPGRGGQPGSASSASSRSTALATKARARLA